ncbi:hypothetical protein ACEWY4_017274 [Coilia grayii]|uniref:Immunoglobulin domain-containing protein n=1 Tax=Coilia grayii TaxID=363190 RepID=A0ABD1JHU3_9TELE
MKTVLLSVFTLHQSTSLNMKTVLLNVFTLLTVEGLVGGRAVVRCPYPRGYGRAQKYLCRGDCSPLLSKDLPVQTAAGQTWAKTGRFSLHDNTTARVFTVTITGLTAKDSGKYWCGVQTPWHTPDLYTELWLRVVPGKKRVVPGKKCVVPGKKRVVSGKKCVISGKKRVVPGAVAWAVLGLMAGLLVLLGILVHLRRRHKGTGQTTGTSTVWHSDSSQEKTQGWRSNFRYIYSLAFWFISGEDTRVAVKLQATSHSRSTAEHLSPVSFPNSIYTNLPATPVTSSTLCSTALRTEPSSSTLCSTALRTEPSSSTPCSTALRTEPSSSTPCSTAHRTKPSSPTLRSTPVLTALSNWNQHVHIPEYNMEVPMSDLTNRNPSVDLPLTELTSDSPYISDPVYQNIGPPSTELPNKNSHLPDLTNERPHVLDAAYQSMGPPSTELTNESLYVPDAVYQSMAPLAKETNSRQRAPPSGEGADVNEYMTMQDCRRSPELCTCP